MRYRYVKALPRSVSVLPRARRVLPFFSLGAGIFLIGWVVIPIFLFFIFNPITYQNLISPLPDSGNEVLGFTTIDYTKAQNWFPTQAQKKTIASVDGYRISIPKLKIKDAYVTIGSDDLSKSLIHYGGTGLPGQYGTTVVFGHSILPQFFDPTNYKAIFSTLPTLKTGDEINVNYDGVSYTYVVEGSRVVKPDDVTGLEQRYDNSYLTLVTCVPPGTYLARLWVTARLKT